MCLSFSIKAFSVATSLLLTTTGRKSGEPRTSALIFAQDGDDYLDGGPGGDLMFGGDGFDKAS